MAAEGEAGDNDWHVRALERRRRRVARGSPVVLTSAHRAPRRGRGGFPDGRTYFVSVRAYATPEPAEDEPARGREITQFVAVVAPGAKPPPRLEVRHGADAERYLSQLKAELRLAANATDFLKRQAAR